MKLEISLLKVHGSSNTFYLYETEQEDSIDLVSLTKWLCLKNNLDGADGLLLVLPSKYCDAKMRVINADGSEASMCGNGLRCVARYVCEKLGVDLFLFLDVLNVFFIIILQTASEQLFYI